MELITVKYVVDDSAVLKAQKSVAGLTEEELKLLAALRDVETATKNVDATQEKQQRKVSDLEKAFGKLGTQIVAAFSVAAVVQFEKEIIKITSEFQKYQAVLTNLLGSQHAADAAMQSIASTAAKTNFSVQEITETYIKFTNRGLKLTEKEIMNLADVTNASGKSIDQFTEAVLDAMTGENERLKEFGIQAQKNGQTTEFIFRGVKTAVDNSAESIKNYLVELGKVEGVTGATVAINNTLTGRLSALGDSWNQLLVTIGKKQSGVLFEATQALGEFIDNAALWMKDTDQKAKEVTDRRMASTRSVVEEMLNVQIEANKKAGQDNEKAVINAIASEKKKVQGYIDANLAKKNYDNGKAIDDKAARRTFYEEKQILEDIEKEYTEKFKKEADARIEAAKKEAEERAKAMKKYYEELQKLREQERLGEMQIDIDRQQRKYYDEEELRFAKEQGDLAEKEADRINEETKLIEKQNKVKIDGALSDQATQEALDAIEIKREENRKNYTLAVKKGYELLEIYSSAYFDNERQRIQDRQAEIQQQQQLELALYEGNTIAQTSIRQKFEQEQRKLKQEQAKRDREQAIFNILINTAMGITAALASVPPNVPLSIAVGVIGAAQLAAVASKPLPKFKTGTKSVPGHDTGDDSVLAMLRPGEAVVPVAQNQKYKKFVSGIIDDNLFEILPSLQPDVNVVKTLVSNYNTNQSDLAISELKKLNTKMDNLRVTEINIDKKGIQVLQKSLNAEEEIVNRYYFG